MDSEELLQLTIVNNCQYCKTASKHFNFLFWRFLTEPSRIEPCDCTLCTVSAPTEFAGAFHAKASAARSSVSWYDATCWAKTGGIWLGKFPQKYVFRKAPHNHTISYISYVLQKLQPCEKFCEFSTPRWESVPQNFPTASTEHLTAAPL